ncbi:MAG: Gfo/Idh/MocA family oxidoreductase [Paracoccaceae bacterium]
MTVGATLKVACVGAGYFSQYHYGSWARMDRVVLVGSCDRDLEKAKATGLSAYSDLKQMLAEQSPDLLDVILPPVAHAEAIRAALSAGINWIICQKPFCRDVNEARQITQEAEAAGASVIVHENFRFQPWYRTIKQALDRGDVGKVHQVTFRLRPGDGQGRDAYLDRQPYFQRMERFLVHETAVHWIDTFRFLLGNPLSVYADLRRINPVIAGEDAGFILFEHPGGVRALFDGNRHLDHDAENLRCTMGEALIEGTKGTIRLHGDGAVRLRLFGASDTMVLLPAGTGDGFGGDCVHALQSHVIAGILDGANLENIAKDYLIVEEIEAAIYESAEHGHKQVLQESDRKCQ